MRIKNGNISFALWLLAGLVATPVFAKDGDSKTYGSISAKSSNSVTVQGINFTMTSSSQCERSNGSHISCSSIAIGNYVEVSWTGNYLVREIELLSTSNAQPTPSATPGHSSSNDDNGHHSNTSHSSSKSKSSKKQVKIKASFGSDSSSTIAGGRVEYRVKKSETRFLVSISIPENTSPSISSLEEAKALSITAEFSRSGTAYALCTLKLDNRQPEMLNSGVLKYEYKVDLRKKGKKTQFKKGICDLDLKSNGIQKGIPSVRSGDTVVMREATSGDFLSSQF